MNKLQEKNIIQSEDYYFFVAHSTVLLREYIGKVRQEIDNKESTLKKSLTALAQNFKATIGQIDINDKWAILNKLQEKNIIQSEDYYFFVAHSTVLLGEYIGKVRQEIEKKESTSKKSLTALAQNFKATIGGIELNDELVILDKLQKKNIIQPEDYKL